VPARRAGLQNPSKITRVLASRLGVFNTDSGDAWKHLDDDRYPEELALGQAIPLGVDIVVYALTH